MIKYLLFKGILFGAVSWALFGWFVFLAAGTFEWVWGWIGLAVVILGHGISGYCIWRSNPDLIYRRRKPGNDTKSWDKLLLALFGFTHLMTWSAAAIDYRLNGTLPASFSLVSGIILYTFFLYILTWAMLENTFFEKFVRIQLDQNHRVVATGPYRFVRHPGYMATILGFVFGIPLILGSAWSFLPSFFCMIALILRTWLEDRFLLKELPGYKEYAETVKYRLIYGIW